MSLLRTVQEDLLAGLGRVGIAARQAVESVLAGQHRSLHRGLSVEFVGHRPYLPGDDLRHLDWGVWARTDRLDVRLYEEETRLRATVVVDCSGSMAYGRPGGQDKMAFARMLAAGLAFLMVRQGDAVGLATVDHTVRDHLPCASTMGHLSLLLERLAETAPGGETSLGAVLEQLAGRLRRRGLVILISDAFDEQTSLLRALRLLRHRRQDLRVFTVIDPDEEAFPFTGSCEFIGLEQEPHLKLDADRIRHRYRAALADHRRQLDMGCAAAGIPLETFRTDRDLAAQLVAALQRVVAPRRGARR